MLRIVGTDYNKCLYTGYAKNKLQIIRICGSPSISKGSDIFNAMFVGGEMALWFECCKVYVRVEYE
jgi:hypothetical protein